jgi:hypothetical protein
MTSFLVKLEENLSGWPLELLRSYGYDAESGQPRVKGHRLVHFVLDPECRERLADGERRRRRL